MITLVGVMFIRNIVRGKNFLMIAISFYFKIIIALFLCAKTLDPLCEITPQSGSFQIIKKAPKGALVNIQLALLSLEQEP